MVITNWAVCVVNILFEYRFVIPIIGNNLCLAITGKQSNANEWLTLEQGINLSGNDIQEPVATRIFSEVFNPVSVVQLGGKHECWIVRGSPTKLG